jgi:hypothetical protein
MHSKFNNPHIQDLSDLTNPLLGDFEFCKPHLHGQDAMFWRRAFARAACAYVEGTLSALRRFALNFAENQVPRDPARISVLRKESYWSDDDGTIKTRNLTIPRLRYLAMIFRHYAESLGSSYQLDRTATGWRSLTTAFQIRDRISHPDTAVELEINDQETIAIEEAFCFFWNSLAYLWDGASATLAKP